MSYVTMSTWPVWFRMPATEAPQQVTVEASGRTLSVVDLAAFVQPAPGVGSMRWI